MIKIDHSLIHTIYRSLPSDSSKWQRGHALIVAGSRGKMGAAILSASACLRAGAGLLTIHIPKSGETALHVSLPEAMLSLDVDPSIFTLISDASNFQSVGIGPGLGREEKTQEALHQLIRECTSPMVLDADALNILSMHPHWWEYLPEGSVITPHEREFQRLIGRNWQDTAERDALAAQFSKSKKVVVVLKEPQTRVFCPKGTAYVNTTGNAGLAKAGNGDVLTGIVTSFLAQGYSAEEASLLAIYIHGASADRGVKYLSKTSLLATDVIKQIGEVFLALED
jgi:hydroxyethylthiazole kinase-like uncharacterized protein yjeF